MSPTSDSPALFVHRTRSARALVFLLTFIVAWGAGVGIVVALGKGRPSGPWGPMAPMLGSVVVAVVVAWLVAKRIKGATISVYEHALVIETSRGRVEHPWTRVNGVVAAPGSLTLQFENGGSFMLLTANEGTQPLGELATLVMGRARGPKRSSYVWPT